MKFDTIDEAEPVLHDAASRIGNVFAVVLGVKAEGEDLKFVDGDLAPLGDAASLEELQSGEWVKEFAPRAFTAALSLFAKGV